MAVQVSLTGISALFSAEEIECLVRTAGDVVSGDRDDLSSRQWELAQRVRDLIHADDHHSDFDTSAPPAQRLLAVAEELNVEPLSLDDLVHDLVSGSASEINNGGLDAQISYLLGQLGEADTEQAIRDAAQPQHTLCGPDSELRGSMVDGYDDDRVNSILGALSTVSGLRLVCVWEIYDDAGVGGNSDFYVEAAGGRLHELTGGVWRWLNDDPDDPDGPGAPAFLGAPVTWVGPVADATTADFAYDDGLHNYAIRDLLSEGGSA